MIENQISNIDDDDDDDEDYDDDDHYDDDADADDDDEKSTIEVFSLAQMVHIRGSMAAKMVHIRRQQLNTL